MVVISIPNTNHTSLRITVRNAYGKNEVSNGISINISLTENDITKATIMLFCDLKRGVIQKIKKSAYKYQYGATGSKNSVWKNGVAWLFTLDENTFFNTKVIIVKVKYGTPKAIAFVFIV